MNKRRSSRRRSLKIVLLVVIALVVIVRLWGHWFLLKKTNEYLSVFSPVYTGRIDDFRLSLWRGAYGFEGLRLTLREKPIEFLVIDDIDVSIAWRELFQHAKIKTDIVLTRPRLLYSDYVMGKLRKAPDENAKDAKDAGERLFPISIESVVFKRGEVGSADFFGVTDRLPVVIEDIDGELTNLTPTEKSQISTVSLEGRLSGNSPLKINGVLNTFVSPTDWKIRLSAQNFPLTTTNPWMYHVAPLTFEKGSVRLYLEAESRAGTIEGYVKPFLHDVAFVGDDRDFKGFKQFGIEISLAALNLFFRNSANKTVAARADFGYRHGNFKWNFWQVVKELFKNGYQKPLQEGFDSK